MHGILTDLVKVRFPRLTFACGYGSGVFKQPNARKETMVDLIFSVENSQIWHEENRRMNPSDYSCISRYVLTAHQICRIQSNYGGKIWFNTSIPYQPANNAGKIMIKYGVISDYDLKSDLVSWNTFYLAGRLQKPVLLVQSTPEIEEAMAKNRKYALIACLAILIGDGKMTFSREVLLNQIVGLSYSGDVRVGVAESPTKVADIASGSYNELCNIYVNSDLGKQYLNQLEENTYSSNLSVTELLKMIPLKGNLNNTLELKLKLNELIKRVSAAQTFKGILTAGLGKSALYGATKISKRFF